MWTDEESGRQRDMLLEIAEVIHEWKKGLRGVESIERCCIAEEALMKIDKCMKRGR